MNEPSQPPSLSNAVSEADVHVRERQSAVDDQRPRKARSRKPLVAGVWGLLVVVLGVDAYMWTHPGDPLSLELQRVDVAWVIADAVEIVEAIRTEAGLPPDGEIVAPLIGWEVWYSRDGATYQLGTELGDSLVIYDSSETLSDWMTEQGVAAEVGATR